MVRDHVWLKVARDDAWTRQNCKCYYCRYILTRKEATAEHKVPKSKNGLTNKTNITAACVLCNRAKGNKSHSEFMKLLTNDNTKCVEVNVIVSRFRLKVSKRLEKFEKIMNNIC